VALKFGFKLGLKPRPSTETKVKKYAVNLSRLLCSKSSL